MKITGPFRYLILCEGNYLPEHKYTQHCFRVTGVNKLVWGCCCHTKTWLLKSRWVEGLEWEWLAADRRELGANTLTDKKGDPSLFTGRFYGGNNTALCGIAVSRSRGKDQVARASLHFATCWRNTRKCVCFYSDLSFVHNFNHWNVHVFLIY